MYCIIEYGIYFPERLIHILLLVSTNFCFLLLCRPFFQHVFKFFSLLHHHLLRPRCWITFQWNYELRIVNSPMPSQSLRSTRALMHSYTVEHCHLNSNGRLYLRCMWKLVQQCFQIVFARAWPLSPQPRSILFGSVVTPRHELLQPHCFFIGVCHAIFFLYVGSVHICDPPSYGSLTTDESY